MRSTHISPVPRAIDRRTDTTGSRLSWLLAAGEAEARRRLQFRSGMEEEQMLLMSRPVSPQRAYALFGMLLGALAPAAIFSQMLGYGVNGSMRMFAWDAALFFLCLVINAVSCLMGYLMGSSLSHGAFKSERSSWTRMLLLMPLIGAAWGAVTGATSGILFFGFGAFVGAAFAIPIGMVAFLAFAIFHRLLERGGMIETRHFLPLACGITLTIAALILGA